MLIEAQLQSGYTWSVVAFAFGGLLEDAFFFRGEAVEALFLDLVEYAIDFEVLVMFAFGVVVVYRFFELARDALVGGICRG